MLAGKIPLLMPPYKIGDFICKAFFSINYDFCFLAWSIAAIAHSLGAPAYLPLAQFWRISFSDIFPA
jgi:hypothetical protein